MRPATQYSFKQGENRVTAHRGRIRRNARLGAIGATVALVAAACGSSTPTNTATGPTSTGGANTASAPGVTATTVTIGSHQPLTGPAAPGYSEIAPASQAFFQYVNAHGGINGRTINYIFKDDGYNPTNTSNVVHQLVLQDNVFAIFNGLGTPTHEAVLPFLTQNKIPDLFVASGCDCWNAPTTSPETFGFQTDYTIEGKILGKYVTDHFAGQKVGFIYQNDDFGQGGVKGLTQEIPAGNIVTQQPYDVNNLTQGLANQVNAAKAAGAQVVVLDTIPAGTALVLLEAAQVGYHPQFVVSSVGGDPPTLTGLLTAFSKGKASSALLDGLVTAGYFPVATDTANPWISLFKQIHDTYDSAQPFDGNTVFGMSVGVSFVEALKAAGKNPTRQSLINAVEQHPANLIAAGLVPFGFSHTSHSGYLGEQVGSIKTGILTLSGPIFETQDTGPITTFTGTQAPPPASF
jgi:branched-chain amino acid transport system substrate-binding protein